MEIEDVRVRRVKCKKETTMLCFIKGKMIFKGACYGLMTVIKDVVKKKLVWRM